MQRADIILSILNQKANDKDFVFNRIYRHLFNPSFYTDEYRNTEISNLIEKLRTETFYIKNASSMQIQLLQLAIGKILKAIYLINIKTYREALVETKNLCRYNKWIVKVKLKENIIDKNALINILKMKIDDGRFLNLIEKFIDSEHMQLQEIILDIYLSEIDKYMLEKFKNSYIRQGKEAICTSVNKKGAEKISLEIRNYLFDKLNIKAINIEIIYLDNKEKFRFLGYNVIRDNKEKKIQLSVPIEVVNNRLEMFMKNGKAVHCSPRINLSVTELIKTYNIEIENLYKYYSLAIDVNKKLGRFKFYHYSSLIKTIARKEKSSVKKVIEKYGLEVKLKNGEGTKKLIAVRLNDETITYFNEPLNVCKI